MKAPITQAQAWAVIAESAGWNVKELPVLPEPAEETWRNNARYFIYTADQLQSYGQQCAAHAREMALSEVETKYTPLVLSVEEAIRNGVLDIGIEMEIEVLKGK